MEVLNWILWIGVYIVFLAGTLLCIKTEKLVFVLIGVLPLATLNAGTMLKNWPGGDRRVQQVQQCASAQKPNTASSTLSSKGAITDTAESEASYQADNQQVEVSAGDYSGVSRNSQDTYVSPAQKSTFAQEHTGQASGPLRELSMEELGVALRKFHAEEEAKRKRR